MKKMLIAIMLVVALYGGYRYFQGAAGTVALSSYMGPWKDGTYTGQAQDNQYGTVQVAAVVSGGKITAVNFLQAPSDRAHSLQLSTYAEPQLQQETIQAQNANVNIISGATLTSEGYMQSLQTALSQAM